MKRMTSGSRWVSGIGVVGVLVAMLSTGVLASASEGRTTQPTVAAAKVPSQQVDRLERLARQVADPSGGRVTQLQRDEVERAVSLVAVTASGDFQVSAWLSEEADGVQTGRDNCRADQQHPQDGRICTTLRSTSTLGVWSREYPGQPGRQTLELAATALDGGSLWVQFSNYTETEDGSKQVGPRWQDAGVSVSRLRRAAERSGLIVVQN
jgi:hypothetical protein